MLHEYFSPYFYSFIIVVVYLVKETLILRYILLCIYNLEKGVLTLLSVPLCIHHLTHKGRNYPSDVKTQFVPRSKHSLPRL